MDGESDTEKAKTNAEVRQWYLEQISHIPELNERWRRQGLSARERAERTWRIRCDARLQARSMMADPTEVELLRQRDLAVYGNLDGPTLEFLVEKLRGAYRTDVGIDESLGL